MNEPPRTPPPQAEGQTRSSAVVTGDEADAALARLESLFRKCRGEPASEALLQGLRDYRRREAAQ